MHKITQKQKLDLRIIERWAAHSLLVEWEERAVLSKFLGWHKSERITDEYKRDLNCRMCLHTTYTEQERIMFNRVRKLYYEYIKFIII